jgi:hypothetical protein
MYTYTEKTRKEMKIIYGIMSDNGDGYCSLEWYRSKEVAWEIIELFPGEYWSSEGHFSQRLQFPDGLKLDTCGFSFSDQDAKDRIFDAKAKQTF